MKPEIKQMIESNFKIYRTYLEFDDRKAGYDYLLGMLHCLRGLDLIDWNDYFKFFNDLEDWVHRH